MPLHTLDVPDHCLVPVKCLHLMRKRQHNLARCHCSSSSGFPARPFPNALLAASEGCSSPPVQLLVLLNIFLTIFTEAQDKDQLSRQRAGQQKRCFELFPCRAVPCRSDGCHAPGVPPSSGLVAPGRHCWAPPSTTGHGEKMTPNISLQLFPK